MKKTLNNHKIEEILSESSTLRIRKITADNGNAFTYRGTNTYVVGNKNLAVIDPGPNLRSHLTRLKQSFEKSQLTHIILTHSHQDHCASAIQLSRETSAPIYMFDNQKCSRNELLARIQEDHSEVKIKKDLIDQIIIRTVKDGERLTNNEWCLEVIATPGHMFDHICLALKNPEIIFTGDHVMGWSSTVIIPPMGNMSHFFLSLKKLLDRHENTYFPGHGPVITNAKKYVRSQLTHREHRKNQILQLLQIEAQTPKEIAKFIYPGVDINLQGAAESNVYAHLLNLIEKKIARTNNKPTIKSRFFLNDKLIKNKSTMF